MNQLEDLELIEVLCDASSAGVPVDLIVRGYCCLRPGIAGRTGNIRIRSIIGCFLEHSRIFHFAAGHEGPKQGDSFIGPADWMFRNLSMRVDVVTPIFDAVAKAELRDVLNICLRDDRQARVPGPDGSHSQLKPDGANEGPEAEDTHATLMKRAKRRSE